MKTGTNTRSIQTGAKIAHAPKRMRPATAPEISAGVITANMPRNTITRMEKPPSSPVIPIPRRNALSSPPMKSFSNGVWASENPTVAHSTGIVSRHQKFIINMLRTLRERSIPP